MPNKTLLDWFGLTRGLRGTGMNRNSELYISGVRNAEAVGVTVADFGSVRASKNILTAQLGPKNINGIITWNAD